ncbi:MAG TPA: Rrf2 family transcriptional regulator, partial [Pirellulaceae bacterium]|nr:Rrf2 family transcriptional regulator [Pirellulaceae bacterium]
IADLHGIPSPFLVQILLQLKGSGVVESTRGAAGGYRLVRDPEQLTMGEVVDLMEGGGGEVQSSASNRTPGVDAILEVWQDAVSAQRQLLANITFAQLVERSRGSAERMYYI